MIEPNQIRTLFELTMKVHDGKKLTKEEEGVWLCSYDSLKVMGWTDAMIEHRLDVLYRAEKIASAVRSLTK